jgi:hypothetical protein
MVEREVSEFKEYDWCGVPYPLPIKEDVTLFVNLSGGADSALGLYAMCDLIQKNNLKIKVKVLTYIRGGFAKPWQRPIAVRVFEALKDLFPDIVENQILQFIPETIEHGVSGEIRQFQYTSGDQVMIREYNQYLVYGSKEAYMTYNYSWFTTACVHPFANKMKDWVMEQYHANDLSSILYLTRSCEATIDALVMSDFKDGTKDPRKDVRPDQLPICGTCWWCRERAWANDQVHKRLHK